MPLLCQAILNHYNNIILERCRSICPESIRMPHNQPITPPSIQRKHQPNGRFYPCRMRQKVYRQRYIHEQSNWSRQKKAPLNKHTLKRTIALMSNACLRNFFEANACAQLRLIVFHYQSIGIHSYESFVWHIYMIYVYGVLPQPNAAHTQRVREHYQISLLKSLERNTASCSVLP